MRAFVEQMARMLADWGFPPMAGRVLFAMMGADERSLTAAELAERLEVSPAAISGAVRYLTQINRGAREPVPGSRRDRYRLLDDTWYEITVSKLTLFTAIRDVAEQGIAAAGGRGTPAGARLGGMADFYGYVQERLPDMLRDWAARKPS